LKNGFAAAQKSFSLLVCLHVIVINYWMLNSITDRRKTFYSLLANHFSAVMQSSLIMNCSTPALLPDFRNVVKLPKKCHGRDQPWHFF